MIGPGTPSNRTRVPDTDLVMNCRSGVSCNPDNASGPSEEPKIVMISPGAIAPGKNVAAFVTPAEEICGVSGVKHGADADRLFLGDGGPVVKSVWLSFVSTQPPERRIAAVVFVSAAVGRLSE